MFFSCKHCGIGVEWSPSRVHGGFCSRTCFGLSKTLPDPLCLDCKGVLGRSSRHRQLRCMACRSKNQRILPPIPCVQCGKDVLRSPAQLATTKRRFGVFCGRQCFGQFVTGPNNPAFYSGGNPGVYGPMFKSMKPRVLARDGGVCFVCGAVGKLDVHHVNRDKKNNSMLNLVAVCRTCHRKLENEDAARSLLNALIEKYGPTGSSTSK